MRKRAFSILEASLIAFLLLVVMVVVSNLFGNSMKAVRHSEARTYANTVAESALEALRSKGFGALPVGDSDWPDETYEGTTYHTKIHVAATPQADLKVLKSVRATVSYRWGAFTTTVQREVWISALKS